MSKTELQKRYSKLWARTLFKGSNQDFAEAGHRLVLLQGKWDPIEAGSFLLLHLEDDFSYLWLNF